MREMEKIKAHYNFTMSDADNLKGLLSIVGPYRQEFVEGFYNYVKNFDQADKFLKDETVIRDHQEAIGIWFTHLFSGNYGYDYFKELERVGMAHVKIKLSAHYVNASMHFVKSFLMEVLRKEIEDDQERPYLMRSLDKILDINLDVFTSSYIAEEKKEVFLSHKLENFLIEFSKRFTYGLNLILVLGLVGMGLMVMVLIGYDITHILDGNIEKGLLATLGSLLMLWVVIELMDTEIDHLRGGKFAIKVFVSVALVAVIRKILVTTLSAEAVEAQLSLIAAVAVLGAVYWLIARVDK